MLKSTAVLCLAVCASILRADCITTVTDDIINGTVTGIRNGKIQIRTAFAGTLSIAQANIARINYDSDNILMARRQGGKKEDKTRVKISKDRNGNLILIPEGETTRALSLTDVKTLWNASDNDPDFPPIKVWSYSASFGLSGNQGNTKNATLSLYADAVRTTPDARLKLYGSLNRSESEGELTAEQYLLGLDFEHRPWEHHSWYLRDEAENNEFSDRKVYNTISVGYGFYLWNTNVNSRRSQLRLRVGLAQTHQDFYTVGLRDTNDFGLDFGLLFHYDFRGGVKWNTDITYTPNVDDFSDGHIVHESKLSYVLAELGRLSSHLSDVSLDLGMRNEYDLNVPDDRENLDTSWYIRLSKSW